MKMQFFTPFMCIASLGFLLACQPSPTTQTLTPVTKVAKVIDAPVKSRKQMVVQVAAKMVACYGAFGPTECLAVTFPDGRTKPLTEGIHGYQHNSGQSQRLLVERIEYDTSDPLRFPQDISSVQYRMIRKM